ncbi:hypothetical protein [Streptomyces sp. NPDC002328]|uniref:hypothetical protein n=1 Tax=Streptomyces sp. NPDC002328 TaxID=3364642 RepID=UPI0036CDAAAF
MTLPLTRRIARAALLVAAGAAAGIGAAGSAGAAPALPAAPGLGGLTALDGANADKALDGAAGQAVKQAVPVAQKAASSVTKGGLPGTGTLPLKGLPLG